jgi:hypothetical protein
MAFDLDTYKRVGGRLDLSGIDLDAFIREPLRPADVRCLRYMHDVEYHTTCYLRDLLNTRAHQDPEISTFLTMWSFEELWHGEALAAVLAAHGEPAGVPRVATMRRRLRSYLAVSPLLWMAISAATPHFLAIHMTFGVINEWTTQAGYARLAARAEHPVLNEVLRRIMRQEGRHIDFYLTRARQLLADSRKAQVATRRALRLVWEPVGAGVMPEGETRHLADHLFGDAAGREAVARIDRRIDRLPGLDGLALLGTALARYRTGAEPASPPVAAEPPAAAVAAA